jgi:hypothetical protein
MENTAKTLPEAVPQSAQRFHILGGDQLLITYIVGAGAQAQTLAAGAPFHVSLNDASETTVVFSLQLLDASSHPIKKVHWHLTLSGPMAKYGEVDNGGSRSQNQPVDFDTDSGDPTQVKWIFPAFENSSFLEALSGSPGGGADVSTEVEAWPKPEAPGGGPRSMGLVN